MSAASASPRERIVYLAASALLLFVAIWGWEDAGFWMGFAPYAVAALISVIQYFRPHVALWWLIFVVFAAGSTLNIWILIRDLWNLATDERIYVLLDLSDAVAYGLYLLTVLGITIGLLRIRPGAD